MYLWLPAASSGGPTEPTPYIQSGSASGPSCARGRSLHEILTAPCTERESNPPLLLYGDVLETENSGVIVPFVIEDAQAGQCLDLFLPGLVVDLETLETNAPELGCPLTLRELCDDRGSIETAQTGAVSRA